MSMDKKTSAILGHTSRFVWEPEHLTVTKGNHTAPDAPPATESPNAQKPSPGKLDAVQALTSKIPTVDELAERARAAEGPFPESEKPLGGGTVTSPGSGQASNTPLKKRKGVFLPGATIQDSVREDFSPDQARDEGGRWSGGGAGGESSHPSGSAAGEPAHDVHSSAAERHAAQTEKHAQILREAAQLTKSPEHDKMAKKAEMHAKMAREAAGKAKDAKTPVTAAHHTATAQEHSAKAAGIRDRLKRSVQKAIAKQGGESKEPALTSSQTKTLATYAKAGEAGSNNREPGIHASSHEALLKSGHIEPTGEKEAAAPNHPKFRATEKGKQALAEHEPKGSERHPKHGEGQGERERHLVPWQDLWKLLVGGSR